VARPRKYDVPLETVSAKVTHETREALDRCAAVRGVTRNALIRDLIEAATHEEAPATRRTSRGATTHGGSREQRSKA
jgi:hypothetical protein